MATSRYVQTSGKKKEKPFKIEKQQNIAGKQWYSEDFQRVFERLQLLSAGKISVRLFKDYVTLYENLFLFLNLIKNRICFDVDSLN